MKCNECCDWLNQYIDGELGQEESARVGEHLLGCQECRAEHEMLSATKRAVQTIPEYIPPEEYTEAWKESLDQQTGSEPSVKRNSKKRFAARVVVGLGAAAAALLMVVQSGPFKEQFQPTPSMQQAMVSPTAEQYTEEYSLEPDVTSPQEPEPFVATTEEVQPESDDSSGGNENDTDAVSPINGDGDQQPEPTQSPSAPEPTNIVATPPPSGTDSGGQQQKDDNATQTISVNTNVPVNKVAAMFDGEVAATPNGTTISVRVTDSNSSKVNSVISQLGGGQTARPGDTVVFSCGEADYS